MTTVSATSTCLHGDVSASESRCDSLVMFTDSLVHLARRLHQLSNTDNDTHTVMLPNSAVIMATALTTGHMMNVADHIC